MSNPAIPKNLTKRQKWFREKKFSIDQYWKLSYTLYENKSAEDIYVSVVKARSFEFAKRILTDKIKEDQPEIKLKNIRGLMFHPEFKFERSNLESENKITIKDWENIRNCSFPNQNDFLFKLHLKYITPQEIFKRNKEKIENFV